MKKVFFLLAVVSFAVVCVAQNGEKNLKQYGYWDNWFIQGQLGGQYTFSECQQYSSFSGKLSTTAALNVGKYFSPEAGARIQLGGWTSKNNLAGSIYNVKYFNANIDALFNMTNIFMPYKEGRVFNFIGILGVGFVHTFPDSKVNVITEYQPYLHTLQKTNSGSIRIGLQADFRLSNAWSLNVEANGNLLRDDFNGQEKYLANNDATLNVLAGITYRFNKRGFATVEAFDPVFIQSLNDQNNMLRLQVKEYKACCENKQLVPESKTNSVEMPVENDTTLISVIVFPIGKTNIEIEQDANLYNVARYMKQHPQKKITIVSYTDTEASTADIKLKVSEKRTAAVYMALIEKFEIPGSRLTIVNYSGRQQPFHINNVWNTINIYTSK